MTKEQRYVSKYEAIKDKLQKEMEPGEEMKHCLDKESFQGKFYKPEWVVTSRARIYSLYANRFLPVPLTNEGRKKKDGTYPKQRHKQGQISSYRLVANYFCSKAVIKKYGENNVEVHHKKQYDERKSNSENNNVDNIEYTYKITHSILNKIQKGTLKLPDNIDDFTKFIILNAKYQNLEIWVTVNDDFREEWHIKEKFYGTPQVGDDVFYSPRKGDIVPGIIKQVIGTVYEQEYIIVLQDETEVIAKDTEIVMNQKVAELIRKSKNKKK